MTNAVIGALRVNLGIDSAAFSDGLKAAQGGLSRFGKAVQSGLTVAATAAGAAIGAMGYAVKGTIDAADDMSKAASKIGIPIEELSRLKYAADLSGVSFEGLQTAVGRLSRVMNEAKNGNQAAVDSFAQLGVTATNADGSLKTTTTVLQEMADRFAAMPDGAEKTALAMELMGRSGATMIPLLNGGADALAKLAAEADTFGQVFTAEMGVQAETFNDNISRLTGTFGALTARIAQHLLPYLAEFTNWLVANTPQITQFAVSTVQVFGQIGTAVASAAAQWSAAKVQIQAFFDGVNALEAGIMNFLSGTWAQFEAAWDGMTAKVGTVKAAIAQFAADLVQSFAAIPARMMEIGGQIIDGLWQGIQAKWATVKAGIADLGSSVYNAIAERLQIRSPSRVMHEVGENIVQGLANGMESLRGSASGGAESIADSISSAFQSIGSSIGGAIAGTRKWSDVLKDVLKTIGQIALQQLSKGFGGSGFGGAISGILSGLIGFANGGSIMPGGSGGIDSQVVAFRKSPTEQVDIYDPRKASRGGGGGDIRVFVDQDGNWRAEVMRLAEGPANRAAGAVAAKVPGMVDQRNAVRSARGTRA